MSGRALSFFVALSVCCAGLAVLSALDGHVDGAFLFIFLALIAAILAAFSLHLGDRS